MVKYSRLYHLYKITITIKSMKAQKIIAALIAPLVFLMLTGCPANNKTSTNQPVAGVSDLNIPAEQLQGFILKANGGDAESAFRLHLYYDAVKNDHQAGLTWLTKAAELGLPKAQYNLGVAYSYIDSIKDPEKTKYWMEKAAQNGDADAIEYVKNHYM